MAYFKSAVFVLGLLFVCGLVQAQSPNAETTVGSTDPITDPITFKFADEDTAGAPADVESEEIPDGESFWSQSTEDVEGPVSETSMDSFAESQDYTDATPNEPTPYRDDNAVIFDNAPEGGNVTTADEEGFDMTEDDDSPSTASEDSESDLGAASFAKYSCSTGNPVDDCWRCDPNWASNRQRLANCAVGFGRSAIGGKNGRIYVVTSSRDDNPANPAPGTLRYAVTRPGPLWITFAYSMTIRLKNELMITSFKTIDGRGVNVHIAGGGGLTLQRISNVIIHGISIHDIKPTGPGRIMTSTSHVGNRGRADGDAISIFSSKNIWVDHCYLARAADGLIDVIRGSTGVSITNNYFTQHDKVMLLGAHKDDSIDRNMHVTVAYNIFGPKLVQRMPRVRFGNVHVLNNDYTSGWGIYAIAGSEDPTILSQGNIFNAYKGSKQVTKRINDGGNSFGGPKNWNWRSEGDKFLSGAFFTSVPMKWSSQSYGKTASCSARPASMVVGMVRGAGPLNCRRGARC
ncbi:hypothetical protein KC19_2G214600 [Ceratodon purpureus]|uniref:Pectate lyase n=1 Tax=Ceratodon purpureus TaxID=3225 RepID=A0A8T0IZK6_CERPU|nr:hypothetical protein KC19_2G214600 [Ceratodon purpureus]